MLSFDIKAYVVLITKLGIGKRVLLKDFEVSRVSKTIKAIGFKKPNDQLIGFPLFPINDVLLLWLQYHL